MVNVVGETNDPTYSDWPTRLRQRKRQIPLQQGVDCLEKSFYQVANVGQARETCLKNGISGLVIPPMEVFARFTRQKSQGQSDDGDQVETKFQHLSIGGAILVYSDPSMGFQEVVD